LDLIGAARIVLRDWNSGKFARYTTPSTTPPAAPPAKSSSNSEPISISFLTPLYAKDEAILAVLATRKEIRKQKEGLVKLSPGKVEERQASVEENWVPLEDDEAEGDDDDEWENDDGAGMVLFDEEEEEESEGDEEEQEGDGEGSSDEDEQEQEEQEEGEEGETTSIAPESRKQKRKRGLENPARARPTKRVSINPQAISSSKGRKDQPRPHQQNLPEAKVKSKPASVAVPKAVTKPKGILKNAGAAKSGVAKKPVTQARSDKAGNKKEGERDEPESYDFGRFF
jgi:nuclear GTP-binding protein